MVSPSEAWMREYKEALKLADELNILVSDARSFSPTGPQTHRHFSTTRRKITILKTKLETLEILRSQLPSSRQPITKREMNKRKDMLENVRSKVEESANTLNSYSAANRDRLLGQDINSDEIMKKVLDMDNQDVVAFQRQIIEVQDEDIGKLEETVVSTKHIAIAINEELDLQTRLLDTVDDHVETTGSMLHRVQKRLAVLNKHSKGNCSCFCLTALTVVILIFIIVALVKFL